MEYNFDEIIDRRNTNSENMDGWRTYIFKDDPDRVFPYKDDEFIRMWVADMEFAVAPEIRQAIADRLEKKILGYTAVWDPEYYTALARWCKDRYRLSFPKEQLVFSPGVIPVLYQFVEDLVEKDEKVITFTPAYGFFLHACEYSDVKLVCSALKRIGGRFEPDYDDFAKKAADPKVKMLMLCNPHNPTGTVWTEEELRKIGEIAEKNDLWIVSDEIHCDLLRSGLRHTPMANAMPKYEKLITCMSASKTFNLAGMLHSNIIIRNREERRRFVSRDKNIGSANPLSLAAHKAAYSQGIHWLESLKKYLDGNFEFVRNFLKKNIPEAKFTIPGATYFAWIDLRNVLPTVGDLPLFFAENAGVLLEGGNGLFVADADGYVRLNLAMPRLLVERGLARIKDAIKEAKSASNE